MNRLTFLKINFNLFQMGGLILYSIKRWHSNKYQKLNFAYFFSWKLLPRVNGGILYTWLFSPHVFFFTFSTLENGFSWSWIHQDTHFVLLTMEFIKKCLEHPVQNSPTYNDCVRGEYKTGGGNISQYKVVNTGSGTFCNSIFGHCS